MQPQPSKKAYQDEWGDTTRIGYEDKPVYQPRKRAPGRQGNKFLGSLGSLLIVGALLWGTYLLTSNGFNASVLLKFPGPVHVAGAGVIVSIISRFV